MSFVERGIRLSGDNVVSIARALYKKASVIILDEATMLLTIVLRKPLWKRLKV